MQEEKDFLALKVMMDLKDHKADLDKEALKDLKGIMVKMEHK